MCQEISWEALTENHHYFKLIMFKTHDLASQTCFILYSLTFTSDSILFPLHCPHLGVISDLSPLFPFQHLIHLISLLVSPLQDSPLQITVVILKAMQVLFPETFEGERRTNGQDGHCAGYFMSFPPLHNLTEGR